MKCSSQTHCHAKKISILKHIAISCQKKKTSQLTPNQHFSAAASSARQTHCSADAHRTSWLWRLYCWSGNERTKKFYSQQHWLITQGLLKTVYSNKYLHFGLFNEQNKTLEDLTLDTLMDILCCFLLLLTNLCMQAWRILFLCATVVQKLLKHITESRCCTGNMWHVPSLSHCILFWLNPT